MENLMSGISALSQRTRQGLQIGQDSTASTSPASPTPRPKIRGAATPHPRHDPGIEEIHHHPSGDHAEVSHPPLRGSTSLLRASSEPPISWLGLVNKDAAEDTNGTPQDNQGSLIPQALEAINSGLTVLTETTRETLQVDVEPGPAVSDNILSPLLRSGSMTPAPQDEGGGGTGYPAPPSQGSPAHGSAETAKVSSIQGKTGPGASMSGSSRTRETCPARSTGASQGEVKVGYTEGAPAAQGVTWPGEVEELKPDGSSRRNLGDSADSMGESSEAVGVAVGSPRTLVGALSSKIPRKIKEEDMHKALSVLGCS